MHHKLITVLISLFIINSFSLFAQTDQEQLLFNLGEKYFNGKEFEKSLEIYSGLRANHPSNMVYFDRYWRSLFETGKYEDAHSALEQEYSRTQIDGYILEMAKISVTSGKQERGEKEWEILATKYNSNFPMTRTIASSMIALKQYDLARKLYESKRTEKLPTLFAMELANLYTSTFNSEKAAKEFLNLLIENPSQDGFIEGRINQYYSDSLQSAKILSVFEKANKEKYPASLYRLVGNLYRNTDNFDKAFSAYQQFDKLTGNQGNSTFSFFLTNADNLKVDSLYFYVQKFKSEFPASRYYGNMELRISQILFDHLSANQTYFEKIEKIYLNHTNQTDFSSFSDLYLRSILKSGFTKEQKTAKIQDIIKSKKSSNSDYWVWVLKVLSEDYSGALKLFENPGMKTSFAWEYVQTSLASKIPIDSLRWQLLTFSSDFKNREVPKYLFLLIQSVPVPNLNFETYVDYAKASVQKSIFQSEKAQDYFKAISENSDDHTLAVMAKSELVSLWIESGKSNELSFEFDKVKNSKDNLSVQDEVLFKLGTYFVLQKKYNNAKVCFELLIENSPASPFLSLSRNQLNEIRKKISS